MNMRRYLFIILLMISAACSAQNNHMKFKGIPMDGTLQSFTSKLKAQGYTSLLTLNGVATLKGEFAVYKNCTIKAIADQSGMICKVTVSIPKMDKWSELESCYKDFKSMLTDKYGRPTQCVEEFQRPQTDDDFTKLHALKTDGCKYYSIFTCDNGEIQLEMTYKNFNCHVVLSYFDNANQAKLKKQIMDDL